MNYTVKLLLASLLLSQTLSAEEIETVKVTLLRKNVQVIVAGETRTPKIDDELPLDSKIQSDAMGYLEFEYKGMTYKIGKSTSILLADAVKMSGDKSYKPDTKTEAAGVRGLDEVKKGSDSKTLDANPRTLENKSSKSTKKKTKKKQNEDN